MTAGGTRPALAAVLALAAAAPGWAQDSSIVAPKAWDLTADLGLVNTAGNTSVTTLNANQQFTWVDRRWRLQQQFRALYSETDGTTSAQYVVVAVRGDYTIGSGTRAYLASSYDRNPFADVGQRFEQGAGLIFGLIATERDTLTIEAGGSVAEQATADFAQRFTFGSGRLAGTMVHFFSPGGAYATLRGALLPTFLGGDGGLRFFTEAGVVAPVTRKFAIRVAYRIQQDNANSVTGGESKIDRYLTTNLQIRF